MPKCDLDLADVPDLAESPIFHSMSQWLEARLVRLEETHDRAWGALHFSYGIQAGTDTLHVQERHLVRAKEANLRAALAEFVGMEAALERDLRERGVVGGAIKIYDTRRPLPHVLRELRNLELHLHSGSLAAEHGVAYWRPPGAEEPQEIPREAWYVSNVTAEKFLKLSNARAYHRGQLTQALDWFIRAQRIWGINELIRLGVEEYGRRIAEEYGLEPLSDRKE